MAPVTLHLPKTVEQALALLDADQGARPLAGGASMVAMMNARLLAPTAIVSLKDIPELRGITPLGRDGFRIGAMTRHYETAAESRLSGVLRCLPAAAGSIANPPVRNMGTMGGSIALADPGADYPAALVAAGAEVEIASLEGRRRIPASDFFVDWYTTALAPGEIVTAIFLPPARTGFASYRKLARVAGDFAIVSIALATGTDGAVRVAIGGSGPKPVASAEADALLSNRLGDATAVRKAGEMLAALADPVDDVRATADYRRLIIPRLLAQAAAEAAVRLREAA